MPDREAHRGRALALRGIAEGHEHARHALGDGNAVEHERQTGDARPVQEEEHAGPSVRLNRDRSPDDTRDLEQRIGVTALHRNSQAEIRNEASDWYRGTGWRIRPAIGARVPDRGRDGNQDDDSAANKAADAGDSHSDSRLEPKGGARGRYMEVPDRLGKLDD